MPWFATVTVGLVTLSPEHTLHGKLPPTGPGPPKNVGYSWVCFVPGNDKTNVALIYGPVEFRVRKTYQSSKHCLMENFCNPILGTQNCNFPDIPESFRTPWKVFGIPGKFPNYLINFWTLCNVSGLYAMFLDTMKCFQILCKFYGNSVNFPDTLKIFWILWKYSEHSEKFLLKYDHSLMTHEGNFKQTTCCLWVTVHWVPLL